MLKKRLIAVILVRNGEVVQSVKFKHTNAIHYNAIHAIESFNRWAIDEIVVLNVSKNEESRAPFVEIINKISSECFVPLSVGGWIKDVSYVGKLLANGADKIVVNTQAFRNPSLIMELARKFGRQCVVVSVDSKQDDSGVERVTIDRGSEMTDTKTIDWVVEAEKNGAGELFVNSIDHDGNRKGYNIPLIKEVGASVNIPVIAMGGVLTWDHFIDCVTQANPDAVAAANIFHYTEHSTKKAKRYLLKEELNFRKI